VTTVYDTRHFGEGPQAFVEGLVAEWLPRLGLGHWQVTVDWNAFTPEGEAARISPADDYDTARLQVSSEWATWTVEWAEWTIVHELLHIAMRDVDLAAYAGFDELSGRASRLVTARYTHEVEGMVDRLAAALIAMHRGAAPAYQLPPLRSEA